MKPLPPDPEGQNRDRAGWAYEAVETFMVTTGVDYEDAVSDLICYLMHLCDQDEELADFEDDLARARAHYEHETQQPGTDYAPQETES